MLFFADNEDMKMEKGEKKIISLILISVCIFLMTALTFADSSYTVKKGDTLYSISRKYQITVQELRAANNFSEGDILKEGAKLVIPSADIQNAAALSSTAQNQTEKNVSPSSSKNVKEYEVQKGDTLYGIARKFGISLSELLSMNNLDSGETIKVGQKLKIRKGNFENTSSPAITKTDSSEEKSVPKTPSSTEKTASSRVSSVVWPLSNPTVKKLSGKVSGVLLTGEPKEEVKTVREGTVMYTGLYRGFGEVVFVQSKTGLIYSYTGLGKVSCKKGDYVKAGDELGTTGKNDSSIKFMVFQNGMPIDPEKAPRG